MWSQGNYRQFPKEMIPQESWGTKPLNSCIKKRSMMQWHQGRSNSVLNMLYTIAVGEVAPTSRYIPFFFFLLTSTVGHCVTGLLKTLQNGCLDDLMSFWNSKRQRVLLQYRQESSLLPHYVHCLQLAWTWLLFLEQNISLFHSLCGKRILVKLPC